MLSKNLPILFPIKYPKNENIKANDPIIATDKYKEISSNEKLIPTTKASILVATERINREGILIRLILLF